MLRILKIKFFARLMYGTEASENHLSVRCLKATLRLEFMGTLAACHVHHAIESVDH